MKTEQKPFLSVIIPSRNDEALLRGCLESLARQEIDLPWELIVVDSSTTPACREVAAQYGAKVVHEPRRGKGLALARGAEAARGEIFCFTEADCRVPRHWLKAIAAEFAADRSAVALAGLYTFFDSTSWLNFLAKLILPLSAWAFYLMRGNHSIRGTNFAVRAQPYWVAGGVNKQAKEMQDVELGLRLAKLGKIKLVERMRIETSDRRVRGRSAKFLRELLPAIYRLMVKKQVLTEATYEDVR